MRTGELALAEGGNVGTRDTLHIGVGADVVSGLVWSVGAGKPGGAQDIGNGGNQSTSIRGYGSRSRNQQDFPISFYCQDKDFFRILSCLINLWKLLNPLRPLWTLLCAFVSLYS